MESIEEGWGHGSHQTHAMTSEGWGHGRIASSNKQTVVPLTDLERFMLVGITVNGEVGK